MRAVLQSIRPEWCNLIMHGDKTVEVRKSRPVLPTPFKCYIYETLTAYFSKESITGREFYHGTQGGKVIGEYICNTIAAVPMTGTSLGDRQYHFPQELLDAACLTNEQLIDYGEGAVLYFWHISDLVLYDVPKNLESFYAPQDKYCEKGACGGCPYDQVPNEYGEYSYDCEWKRPIKRPPQSWCYVEELI